MAALAAFVAMGSPLRAGADSTPVGPFGFTTTALGATQSYGEPSLAIAPDGRHELVSTPNGTGVQYWYSSDQGHTWGSTTTVCGGGDSALDFLPDGTAVSADLNFPGGPSNLPDSCVMTSKDFGKTWSDSSPAGIEQDRQWLAHSPDGKRLFLVYHDFIAEAEFYSESDDGGATWTNLPTNQVLVNSPDQVTAAPMIAGGTTGSSASILDQGVNTFSGPMLVDPDGKHYYVIYSISDAQSNLNPTQGVPPFGPVRALVVARSSDAGATWTNTLADVAQVNGTSESIENTLFPWGFIDSAGTVYVVFDSTRDGAPGDHFHQYYVYSKDHGATWSAPVKLDGLDLPTGAAAYATGDAVSPGVIDVAWYESDNGTPSDDSSVWTPMFAQVTGADTAHPTIKRQPVSTHPNHRGGICLQGILCGIGPGSSDRSLLDFFMLRVNPVTHFAEIAYADNASFGKDSSGNVNGEVVVAHQQANAFTTSVQHAVSATLSPQGGTLAAAANRLPNTASGPAAAPLASVAALLGIALLRPVARRRRTRRVRTG
jgi:hypothetical protein